MHSVLGLILLVVLTGQSIAREKSKKSSSKFHLNLVPYCANYTDVTISAHALLSEAFAKLEASQVATLGTLTVHGCRKRALSRVFLCNAEGRNMKTFDVSYQWRV